jgi:hypothetical protein
MRRWDDAARHFERAIEIDAHNAGAYESLAHAHLRRRRWREAAAAAIESIGFEHHRPWAHFYLGIALLRLDQLDRAILAFQTSLSFQPPLRVAHFWLARVLWRIAGRQQEALEHRARARVARETRLDHQAKLELLRNSTAEGAAERIAARAEGRRRIAEEKAAAAERKSQAEARRKEYEKLFTERGPLNLVLVSGLPRSGTSLMMQMLQAGGLPVVTDGERQADTDNPRGYLEWEAVKKLPQDPGILYRADGKVLKIVSALLEHLPRGHRYKIVFMDRPIEEVAASHEKMIRNRGEKGPEVDSERMKLNLERHRNKTLRTMRSAPGVELLLVDYPSLVRDPASWVDRLVAFLGADSLPFPTAMANAIDSDLYRNRRPANV